MVGRRLVQLRTQLAVAEEQLAYLRDDTADAEIRALVSETPNDSFAHREAARHSSAMTRHRDELVARIAKAESEQDRLLDQLSAGRRSS
jgi:3-deoxy-D-manno-octulosonate 8-phosphate phosphatase KdsC-like HAD superfamily phosphatase